MLRNTESASSAEDWHDATEAEQIADAVEASKRVAMNAQADRAEQTAAAKLVASKPKEAVEQMTKPFDNPATEPGLIGILNEAACIDPQSAMQMSDDERVDAFVQIARADVWLNEAAICIANRRRREAGWPPSPLTIADRAARGQRSSSLFFAFSEIDLNASGVLKRLSARQRDPVVERTFPAATGCAGLQSDVFAHPIIARRGPLYAVHALRRRCCSIRTREVSHSELDLTVGKLPPFLDNRHVPDLLTWLTEDFASFAAGRFDRQRKYFWLPRAVHPVCQIAGANEHVRPPSCILHSSADHERRCVKR